MNTYWLEADEEETKRLEKAVMLAPTLTICEALLRGEHVPISKLDQTMLARYGIRTAA